jgi:hypothetical protein
MKDARTKSRRIAVMSDMPSAFSPISLRHYAPAISQCEASGGALPTPPRKVGPKRHSPKEGVRSGPVPGSFREGVEAEGPREFIISAGAQDRRFHHNQERKPEHGDDEAAVVAQRFGR